MLELTYSDLNNFKKWKTVATLRPTFIYPGLCITNKINTQGHTLTSIKNLHKIDTMTSQKYTQSKYTNKQNEQ